MARTGTGAAAKMARGGTEIVRFANRKAAELPRTQGILYEVQDVGGLADEPAHQSELGIALVGQHKWALPPDKSIKLLEGSTPVNDVLRSFYLVRNLGARQYKHPRPTDECVAVLAAVAPHAEQLVHAVGGFEVARCIRVRSRRLCRCDP
jgi:hypothetical protein